MLFPNSEWVPGNYPIPFFQTCKCSNSAVTSNDDFSELEGAGLSPVLLDCVSSNLRLNRVGIDCVHYLFNDDACRDFLVRTFPPDVLYAYDLLIPSAFRADLWRYCILYMFGGVYMDIKYKWIGGGDDRDGDDRDGDDRHGDYDGTITIRNVVDNWLMSQNSGGGGGGDGGGGGCGYDSILVLERDAPGLWPEGHFGIHNAFIISKPKNRLLFECIRQIVSYAKGKIVHPLGSCGIGCATLPLFITGPGMFGDIWRKMHREYYLRSGRGGGGGGGGGVLDSSYTSPCDYALMAQYFRLFYQGDGVIGYLDDFTTTYCELMRVCDNIGYNPPDHYTILWASGILWL